MTPPRRPRRQGTPRPRERRPSRPTREAAGLPPRGRRPVGGERSIAPPCGKPRPPPGRGRPGPVARPGRGDRDRSRAPVERAGRARPGTAGPARVRQERLAPAPATTVPGPQGATRLAGRSESGRRRGLRRGVLPGTDRAAGSGQRPTRPTVRPTRRRPADPRPRERAATGDRGTTGPPGRSRVPKPARAAADGGSEAARRGSAAAAEQGVERSRAGLETGRGGAHPGGAGVGRRRGGAGPGAARGSRRDRVEVDGSRVVLDERRRYWLLNKPAGVVSTAADPAGRPTVVSMVPDQPRVFPVGRLDRDTEGLLLLTNDGPLAYRLTHARYGSRSATWPRSSGSPPTPRAPAQGGGAGGRLRQAGRVRVVAGSGRRRMVEVVLVEGRNREVRRLLDVVGAPVRRLVRTAVGRSASPAWPRGVPATAPRGDPEALQGNRTMNSLINLSTWRHSLCR
jgi:23S rRNA pseudouridine2605 synthase